MKEIFGVPAVITEARRQTKARTKEGKKPGIIWILTLLVFILLLYAGEIAGHWIILICNMLFPVTASGDLYMIVSLAALAAVTAVVILYVRFVERRTLLTLGYVKKTALRQYITGIAAGFVMFSLTIILPCLAGVANFSVAPNPRFNIVILYFLGWLIQGMEEEIMCRGFLLTSLSRRYSVTLGVLVNSALFAALHLANPGIGILPLINLFLFGVFASLMFIKFNNIWICGAFHAVWNFVQGNFYGISVSGNDPMESIFLTTFESGRNLWSGGEFGIEGSLTCTVIYAAGIAILLFVKPIRKLAAPAE